MRFTCLPRQLHEFQQAPSAAEVEALCRRLLGADSRLTAATEITGGFFNTTFVIDREDGPRCVLRVSPPYEHPALFSNERYLLRREFALAPWLAAVGPLLPRVLGADFTGELMSRDAVLSAFIDGENWDAVKEQLTAAQNTAIWRELGTLLQRIHQTRGTQFGWMAPEAGHATWSGFLLRAARGLLADYARLGLPDGEPRQWLEMAEAGAAVLDEIRQPHLVHGDPWPKNVLIRREGDTARIVGLLDHERGLWGDPMNEWVFHHLQFPPAFWETYGPRPTGPGAEFRACVYLGLIDEQAILEGWRYRWDASFIRQRMNQTTQRMRQLLVECGITP